MLSRYRFFSYFTISAFVNFWFPDFLWTSLSTFAFVTWIAPHNQKVNTIFGVSRITALALNVFPPRIVLTVRIDR